MRAASVVVLIAITLPFLPGQFWAYQLGLYALYAAAWTLHGHLSHLA